MELSTTSLPLRTLLRRFVLRFGDLQVGGDQGVLAAVVSLDIAAVLGWSGLGEALRGGGGLLRGDQGGERLPGEGGLLGGRPGGWAPGGRCSILLFLFTGSQHHGTTKGTNGGVGNGCSYNLILRNKNGHTVCADKILSTFVRTKVRFPCIVKISTNSYGTISFLKGGLHHRRSVMVGCYGSGECVDLNGLFGEGPVLGLS